jgi:hypothetical protein
MTGHGETNRRCPRRHHQENRQGKEYRTDLLRRSFRDGKHVRNETLANITHFGPEKVEQLRRTMRGEKLVNIDDAITLTDSRPHGHVNAVLSIARALDFERLIDRTASRERSFALALVVHLAERVAGIVLMVLAVFLTAQHLWGWGV